MSVNIGTAKLNNVTDQSVMMAMEDVFGKDLLGCIDEEHIEYVYLGRVIWQKDDGTYVLATDAGTNVGMTFECLEKALTERSIIIMSFEDDECLHKDPNDMC